MNNKDFIAELAQQTGYSVEDTQRFVNSIVEAMGDHFQENDNVVIPMMVNPSTGQRMLVPPKLVLNFKPNVSWKERVKNGGEE